MSQTHTKIGVLHGGFSREREVSLRSGKNVMNALESKGYDVVGLDPINSDIISEIKRCDVDLVFNVLHGAYGEDGGIQSLLDYHQVNYTGAGVSASVIGINKLLTKQLLIQKSFPSPDYIVASSVNDVPHFPLPYVLKPINEGSSVGICIVETQADYQAQLKVVLDQFGTCLVEKFVSGKEITVSIIDYEKKPLALPILELQPHNKFYDYEAKYTKGMTDFILPARLSEEVSNYCKQLSLDIYKIIGCRSFARIDMIVNEDNHPFVLEVNTVPGMTTLSDLPAQALEYGLSFEDLVDTIVKSAL